MRKILLNILLLAMIVPALRAQDFGALAFFQCTSRPNKNLELVFYLSLSKEVYLQNNETKQFCKLNIEHIRDLRKGATSAYHIYLSPQNPCVDSLQTILYPDMVLKLSFGQSTKVSATFESVKGRGPKNCHVNKWEAQDFAAFARKNH